MAQSANILGPGLLRKARFKKKKMEFIMNSMIDLVTREFCCENYKIMNDEFEDWDERYLKLKKRLE